MQSCIERIDKFLDEEGLYRKAGSNHEIIQLEILFQHGTPDLSNIDVHVCTSLLKRYKYIMYLFIYIYGYMNEMYTCMHMGVCMCTSGFSLDTII